MNTLTYKSVDCMKLVKDNITNQMSDAQILNIVTEIKKYINPTHIALSIPMDTTAQFVANGTTPSPRTIENLHLAWANVIHNAGMGVLWRGTFSGIENIWNFPYAVVGSSNFVAGGTAATASTDGETTYCGRIYRFITQNINSFASGDIFAPIPEGTNTVFDNTKNWVSTTGSQTDNYVSVFNNIIDTATSRFAALGKAGVITGLTTNNYSEINSGWIPSGLFTKANAVVVDDYGSTHTPSEIDSHMRGIYAAKGNLKVFHQEWSDYWNSAISVDERMAYLKTMYDEFRQMTLDGVYFGFNYWGGWTTSVEGILYQDSAGTYHVNGRGKYLGAYYNAPGGTVRIPVVDSSGNY